MQRMRGPFLCLLEWLMRSNLVEPGSQIITAALCIKLLRRSRMPRMETHPLARFLREDTSPPTRTAR